MNEENKPELWQISIGAWKDGASVTAFLEKEIAGLRDADGDPLPDTVKKFLIDLIYQRIKPRKGRALPKEQIRKQYKLMLFLEQQADPGERLHGDTPSDRVKAVLADELKTSVAVIDQIVSQRQSRK
ncbi:MAG: hypothetical protein WA635_06755 [Gallionella sp.]